MLFFSSGFEVCVKACKITVIIIRLHFSIFSLAQGQPTWLANNCLMLSIVARDIILLIGNWKHPPVLVNLQVGTVCKPNSAIHFAQFFLWPPLHPTNHFSNGPSLTGARDWRNFSLHYCWPPLKPHHVWCACMRVNHLLSVSSCCIRVEMDTLLKT